MEKCTGNYPPLSYTCSRATALFQQEFTGHVHNPSVPEFHGFYSAESAPGNCWLQGIQLFPLPWNSCLLLLLSLPHSCSLTPRTPAQDTRNSLQRSAPSSDLLRTSGFLQHFPCSSKRRMDGMKEGGQPAPTPGAAYPKPFPAS